MWLLFLHKVIKKNVCPLWPFPQFNQMSVFVHLYFSLDLHSWTNPTFMIVTVLTVVKKSVRIFSFSCGVYAVRKSWHERVEKKMDEGKLWTRWGAHFSWRISWTTSTIWFYAYGLKQRAKVQDRIPGYNGHNGSLQVNAFKI